jgi:Sec-independent protein secretion pathway component TatC
MTAQQILGLLVKLFAIWIVVTFMYGIVYLTGVAQCNADITTYLYLALLMSLVVGIAAFLWLCPMFVAQKLIPNSNQDNILTVAPLELASVGCFIIGLFAVINSLPRFASSILIAFIHINQGDRLQDFPPNEIIEILALTVLFAIGVYLVKNCRYIPAKFLKNNIQNAQREIQK